MNGFVWAAGLILLPAACTALGAAGVFLLRRPAEGRGRRMLTGGAAGVMLAASIWSLLLPAIERAENQSLPVWLPPAAGLCIGAAGLLWAEKAAGSLLESGAGQGGRMVLAVTLHNLPEGMVTGLAVALALAGAENAVSGAFALSLGIGLQNIPEGAAVSLPLRQQGHSRCRAFGVGVASGLVEPLGAACWGIFLLHEPVGGQERHEPVAAVSHIGKRLHLRRRAVDDALHLIVALYAERAARNALITYLLQRIV